MATVTHIDEALVQVLTSSADVAMLAGNRIYQVQAPQGTAFPCIVLMRDTKSRQSFDDMLGSSGLTRATYTFSCISDKLLEVRNLTRAVRNALQYKSSPPIRLAVVRDENEQQEPPPGGEQLPIHRTDLSVEVTYTET